MIALMLIFVFTVSAAAQSSPTGKEYYKISTDTQGSGTATASANKVEKESGETVTLTAVDEDGFFTRWIIDGDYELVDGATISDPVITVIPHSDLNVTGNFSVEEDYLNMTAVAVTPGHDTAAVAPARVRKGADEQVVFTATEVDSKFIEWEFQCDYKLVSGDLKSKTVTIIPYTDVKGIAYFEQGATPPNPDDSETAPRTGDPVLYVIPFMMMALAAAIVAAKKLKAE